MKVYIDASCEPSGWKTNAGTQIEHLRQTEPRVSFGQYDDKGNNTVVKITRFRHRQVVNAKGRTGAVVDCCMCCLLRFSPPHGLFCCNSACLLLDFLL